jgi:hypothetical protein
MLTQRRQLNNAIQKGDSRHQYCLVLVLLTRLYLIKI